MNPWASNASHFSSNEMVLSRCNCSSVNGMLRFVNGGSLPPRCVVGSKLLYSCFCQDESSRSARIGLPLCVSPSGEWKPRSSITSKNHAYLNHAWCGAKNVVFEDDEKDI